MADELIPERAPAFQLPVPADGLERLVGKAKNYAKGAKAGNTQTAYGADWRDYAA